MFKVSGAIPVELLFTRVATKSGNSGEAREFNFNQGNLGESEKVLRSSGKIRELLSF